MRTTCIVLILVSITIATTAKVKKCCPQHQVLQEDKESNTTRYECTEYNNEETSFTPIGTKMDYTETGIPNCTEKDICRDKSMDDSVITLNCEEEVVNKVELIKEHKCCPDNMVYNIKYKNCEYIPHRLISQMETLKYFQDSTDVRSIKIGLPHCNGTVIDIVTKELNSDFRGRSFKAQDIKRNEERSVNMNESCIDFTAQKEMVIKTCKHKNICSGISCLRKCCPHGQIYMRTTGRAKCIPKPHLTFDPHHYKDKPEDKLGRFIKLLLSKEVTWRAFY